MVQLADLLVATLTITLVITLLTLKASISVALSYRGRLTAVVQLVGEAQDFYAAFGVGEDSRHISSVDAMASRWQRSKG